MSIEWCRQQQKRAAKEIRKKNPPDWARLALFDAFTEELFLVGAFDRVEVDREG